MDQNAAAGPWLWYVLKYAAVIACRPVLILCIMSLLTVTAHTRSVLSLWGCAGGHERVDLMYLK